MQPLRKRSQVTIFIIIAVILVTIFAILILISRQSIKKTTKQEILGVEEITFDILPINNFVTECLSLVSKDGLKKMGKQGGYLFASQGGTLIDYLDSEEGQFFIKHEGSKVVYNILKPIITIGNYRNTPPSYPWLTFPYYTDENGPQTFLLQNAFGENNMPSINSFSAHSMQHQLEIYVENNIDTCLDFSVFEDQGFNISKKEKNVAVSINENDVLFSLQYPLLINNLVSGEKTEIKDFLTRHKVRMGKIHRFLNQIIGNDISDITFNILNRNEEFDVDIVRDAYENDDLIILTDLQSSGLEIYVSFPSLLYAG